jgi:hypothetical protein
MDWLRDTLIVAAGSIVSGLLLYFAMMAML